MKSSIFFTSVFLIMAMIGASAPLALATTTADCQLITRYWESGWTDLDLRYKIDEREKLASLGFRGRPDFECLLDPSSSREQLMFVLGALSAITVKRGTLNFLSEEAISRVSEIRQNGMADIESAKEALKQPGVIAVAETPASYADEILAALQKQRGAKNLTGWRKTLHNIEERVGLAEGAR